MARSSVRHSNWVARFRRPLTEHACMRWSQPYGGGLLAKSWQLHRNFVVAGTDACGGTLEHYRDAATKPTGSRHLGREVESVNVGRHSRRSAIHRGRINIW